MDLKTRLEDEIIFDGREQAIKSLNENGIFTVEDFINCDINQTIVAQFRKQFQAFQNILKYKYLKIPLVIDVLLEKEYSSKCLERNNHEYREIINDIKNLGFRPNAYFSIAAEESFQQNGVCKMIDIIKRLEIRGEKSQLKDFYIEYYNIHSVTQSLDDREILVALKNELACLRAKKIELDEKISSLEQQISTLEGGTVTNGRS